MKDINLRDLVFTVLAGLMVLWLSGLFAIPSRLTHLESRMESVEARMVLVEARLASVEDKLESMDKLIRSIDSKLWDLMRQNNREEVVENK